MSAIRELVRLQPEARIGLLAAENELPYDRPPLSKSFLLGDKPRESLLLLKPDFYETYQIGLHLGVGATAVDTKDRIVSAADGTEFSYGKLLIACGCALRRLDIPGAELPGLYYLRTVSEAEAIHHAAASARNAVVIGGGFVGMETASVLARICDGVTIIHRADRLCEKFESEEISCFVEELFLDHGVHTVYRDEAQELLGEEEVKGVFTTSGRTLPCDIAVAGIGVVPDLGFLEGSSIETGNGIIVNEYLETSAPDVYAAGDVANFYDTIFGRQRRTEHWDNAIRQGRTAGRNLSGAREAHEHISYFYSTMFDLTYEFIGDMTGYDETIVRGSFDRKSVANLYLAEGQLKAAFLLNRPVKERGALSELIQKHSQLQDIQEQLADEDFQLDSAA